jgi:hypothetical protein
MPYVSGLLKLVHPRNRHPKVFAMIGSYCCLDESGIHDQAKSVSSLDSLVCQELGGNSRDLGLGR